MLTLRSVRTDEPFMARENVALRRMLVRLTYGTHDRQKGFVLLPPEAQALYDALAHRMFSPSQLEKIKDVVCGMDPHELDSDWDDQRLASFVQAMRRHVDRPEWIDAPIRRLHADMRAQAPDKRFRLWFVRAALVAFLTIDFLSTDPEELARLAG